MFSIPTIIGAFYFLIIGILLLWRSENKSISRVFFALCFTAFMWQFSWSMLFQVKDYDTAYLITRLGWTFISFLPTILYHFLVLLSDRKDELKKVYYSYGFSFFLLIALLFSNKFISGVYSYFWGYYPKAGIMLHPLHVLQTIVVVSRGLYLVYQSQKNSTFKKRRIQLQYFIAGVLLLSSGIDYLCNYGLEFYPPGVLFLAAGFTIINYTVIKGKLMDIALLISYGIARFIAYFLFLIILISCYLFIPRNYLPQNLSYFFGSAISLIFICETYNYLIKKVQSFSDSIIVKQRKKNKDKIDLLNHYLESSVSIDQLFKNIKNFAETSLKAELISFYVKKELCDKLQDAEGDYIDIASENNYIINLNHNFVDRVVSARLLVENNEYPRELLNYKESQIFVPFISTKCLVGFALFSSKKLFKFWHYEIFDSLVSYVGIVIDRIRVYQEISLQKQKYLEDKAESLKSLAGSIAHELRNPLNAINLAQNQAGELLGELLSESASASSSQSSPENINQNIKKQLTDINSSISSSVTQANNTINIILSDLSNKPIEASDFSYLSTDKVLPHIIETFGYNSKEQKEKVKLITNDDKNNFIFKAIPDRFTFIIYNLLKNALYYLNQYPNSIVTVGVETKTFEGKEFNSIYVHDTGPGIPAHILPKLFGDFFTSGKKDGTGLGLAFCKRNMKIFDGDIIVESELGKEGPDGKKNGWTKFSLLFPKLSEEEITRAKTAAKIKKILIVDDQQVNLLTTKSRIEQNLANIICDLAISGMEAIKLAKANKYHLILMDIQMPEMNGFETAKKIRQFNKEVPIIAYTSLDHDLTEIKSVMSDLIGKPVADNILFRTISKWITDYKDEFSYLGNKEEYKTALQNKNILMADDDQFNLMLTKKNLENYGLKVTTAKSGKELLEIYQSDITQNINNNNNHKSTFDLILTDINMPPYNGDEAAKEIRATELKHNILEQNKISIIALSGDGEKKDIYHFFNSGITDYFVKGSNPELLIKIVANYLTEKKAEQKDQIQDQILETQNNEYNNFSNLKILNLDNLNFLYPESKKSVFDLFLTSSHNLLNQIKQFKESNNLKELSFYVHSLKGISGNVGAERLFEYAKHLDLDIKHGKIPSDQNWFERLELIHKELVEQIKGLG